MALELARDALDRGIEAAEVLGLDAADARSVARTIDERQGYPSDLYVLGLAGGTGVGKSSLLNAIAGAAVSEVGARRPTTRSAVALLPAGYEKEAAPLLDWLGGAAVRSWASEGTAAAIVDLPDLDSIESAHAARVDAILPRIDAVLWVTDPEKYDDAVFHDRYLLRWMPRLARQALVVNKVDRLTPADQQRVCDDLRQRLRREALPEVPVLGVSAHADIEPLRGWLREEASAKAVVTTRLQQGALDAVRGLASSAGIDAGTAPAPLVTPQVQLDATSVASEAILDLLGPRGLRAQTGEAVWAEASAAGGGPIPRVRMWLGRGSGMTATSADPAGYLRRWRERGSLDRAVTSVRQVLLTAAGTMPAGLRPGLLAAADQAALSEQLARGIDGAVGSPALTGEPPRSRIWPVVGLLQLVATAALLAGIIWLVVLLASGGATPTGSIDLPVLGPMPTPAVLIVGGLLTTFVLDRLLHRQARRLGGQWADSILEDVSQRVSAIVADDLAARLAPVDAARHGLWGAARDAERAAAHDGADHDAGAVGLRS